MPTKPVYLASDLHLGAVPRDTERAFVSFLEEVGEKASRLIVNGDLFDFWFEYRSVIPKGHTRVLGALAALVDGGLRVTLLGGNHDWWGGSFLRDEIGVEFLQHPVTLDLAGRRTLLAHGDGLGAGDLGYRLLRRLLRGRLTRFGFHWLHPDLGAWMARRVSLTDSRGRRPTEGELHRSSVLEAWAAQHLRAHPSLDQVILGHTHVPLLKEVESGRHYLNLGDWITHRSYAFLAEGEPPLLRYWPEPPTGGGE